MPTLDSAMASMHVWVPNSGASSPGSLSDFLNGLKSLSFAENEAWKPREAVSVHGPSRLPIRFKNFGV